MIFALLLAASSPNSALEAERAYSEAVLASGRQAAARSFGPQSDPWPIQHAPETARSPSVASMLQAAESSRRWWLTMMSVESHAERRPELVFPSCDPSGSAVVIGGLYDGGNRVGSYKTLWRNSAEGWRWEIDDYRRDGSKALAAESLQAIEPECSAKLTNEQLQIQAVSDAKEIASVLRQEQAGKQVDWLAVPRRSVAEDVIFVGNDGRRIRRLPAKLPIRRIAGALSSGSSYDETLRWSSRVLDGSAQAHSFQITQWRGPKNGWQIVYYELRG
ncbi:MULTISPECIES: hypothetical protein [Sphingomonadaceae]|jgi:hypothetical protein|uniref:Uncharacterized protein n=9 Tax=Sphingomonadaceae TaxID=41297 RepID=A0A7W7F281_9SPHN|nr:MULTISPECIES: hypothetical protein [Sphingomonadaceae]MBM3926944.1 hypothetical protein [Sphingomonadales bacterium]MBQ8102452.1 hypothetical protein [Afipia sp.]MCI1141147.1 hypothetical protein [Sphingomonas sp. WKB10]MCP3914435.1 hypothetical protein [bacterium]MCP4030967.1 hypothetical protein [Herbaspirillum sp.]